MADLFNKKLLDINVNLYLMIFGLQIQDEQIQNSSPNKNATASILKHCKKLYLKNKILRDLVMLKYKV